MPVAYVEKGRRVYRASAIGHCTRALVAALLGYEEARYRAAEETMSLAAGEGKLHEPSIIEAARGMGYCILQERKQREFTVPVIPGAVVRGHIDGWATSGPVPGASVEIVKVYESGAVVEAKSMSHDRFQAWMKDGFAGGFRPYAWQLGTYMHAFATDRAVYAVKDRNTGKVNVREIEGLPVSWREIKRKIIEVERWYAKGELPPCDEGMGSAERYFCPFAYLHDDRLTMGEGDDEEVLDDVTAGVVSGLAERHLELTIVAQAGERAEKERREINEQLARYMVGKKVTTGSGIEVTRVDGNRPTLDLNLVAEALGMTVATMRATYERPNGFTYFKTKRKGGQ